MTLVLDSTSKSPTGNSYASLAEADAYHEARGFNDEWTSAQVETKNAALAWATRLMERLDFGGYVSSTTQALRWPRMVVFTPDGIEFSRTEVPQFVKDAQAELALYLLREDRTEDQGSVGISEVAVGSVDVKFNTVAGSSKANYIPASVLDLLKFGLARSPGSVAVRLERR